MSKSTATLIRSCLKQAAKELSKEEHALSHAQYVERLTAALSRLGLKHLIVNQEYAGKQDSCLDGACIENCPPGSNMVHRVTIGESQWSLRVTNSGPVLHLEYHPLERTAHQNDHSDLGLFQVMARWDEQKMIGRTEPAPNSWAVTRYGMYLSHSLSFMTDEQVGALSRHFGIPFLADTSSSMQQTASEIAFLKSHSFKSLRRAFRSGDCRMPKIHGWHYGLSMLWAHLVAMSDENFFHVDHHLHRYFSPRKVPMKSVVCCTERLEAYWHQIPTMCIKGDATDSGLFEILAR